MNKKYFILLFFSLCISCIFSANSRHSFSNQIKKINIFNHEYKSDFSPRKLENDKRNLILGIIFDYSWEQIKYFFLSLTKVGYKNCDIVLYTGNTPQDITDKIKSFNINLLPIPEQYLKSNILINNYRWKLYEDYLTQNKDKYNMVFAIELQYTFFQQDIFQFYENLNKGKFLSLFLEEKTLRDDTNKAWVLKFIKENEYNSIADKNIIHAGAIIGTVDIFIEIAHSIWENVNSVAQGLDQSAINYLIYYKKIIKDDELIINNNHGPLIVLSNTDIEVNIDNDGYILNLDSKIAAVVQHYQEKKNIVDKLHDIYKQENENESSIRIFNKEGNNDNKIKEGKGNIVINFLILSLILLILINVIFCSVKYFVNNKKNTPINNKRYKKVKIVLKTSLK
jgi:hypothetical protein